MPPFQSFLPQFPALNNPLFLQPPDVVVCVPETAEDLMIMFPPLRSTTSDPGRCTFECNRLRHNRYVTTDACRNSFRNTQMFNLGIVKDLGNRIHGPAGHTHPV